ncbi:MAG: lipopolysaccharide biosynthesis protein [Burkholderiales bacterium]
MEKRLSARMALAWSFAERYASLLIAVASAMVLARLLTPKEVGIYSLCAALTAIAGILRDFGVSEYLIQEKNLTREKMQAAFGIALTVAWCMGMLVFVGRHGFAAFYDEPVLAQVLAVLTLNFLILPFASPTFAIMNRDMEFRKIFVVQIVSNTVQALTSVALAYRGHGPMSLAWGPVANVTTQTLLLTAMRPRDSLMWPSFKAAKEVLSYGSMFVSSRVVETCTRNAHEFVIANQFGLAAVGLFSRAYGLIEIFYNNVASAIVRVASPAFADDHRSGIPLGPRYAQGTAIFTSIAWPFFGFLAFMSKDIIRVMFGPQWDAAAPIATVLALGMFPGYLFSLAPNLLASTGHVKRRLQAALCFSPAHLICVIAASFISLEAVAASWFFSSLVLFVCYAKHLREVLHSSIWALYRPTLKSAAVAAACALAQGTALWLCQWWGTPGLFNILFVALASVPAWLVATWTLKHPSFTEVVRLLRHVRAAPSP